MRRSFSAALTALLFALATAARADEPPHFTYAPSPPGTLVQSTVVYLAGEAMHSQWRTVLSKTATQWYLSLYAIDGTTYHLAYRSPNGNTPFPSNGPRISSASIVGGGEFMGSGVQQAVILSHDAAGGGCGTARLDVLFLDAAMQMPMSTLTLENRCYLSAKIVHGASGDTLTVTGPIRNGNAIEVATATFAFHNGRWTQSPRAFHVVTGG
ncbi:MAG: hypothetical protein ABR975_00535 [Vulcanimicrobiaceae bacterium]|jgi:hypothetical protein